MIDIVESIIAGALGETLGAACLGLPGGPAQLCEIRTSNDPAEDRDPAALVRIDAQESVTLQVPMETDDPTTVTVAFTVTLRRSELPALTTASAQQMRRAVYQCERAIARALLQSFDVLHFGLIESEGVSVMTPTELTISEPEIATDDATPQGTVTAVFPIQDRHVLARTL